MEYEVRFVELRQVSRKTFLIVNGKHLRCHDDLGEGFQKVKKYTQKCFMLLKICSLKQKGQWVADSTNKMVNELIHNYKIKLNDLQAH
jgi:DNA-directed RNA polymerase subunit beta